MAHLGDQGNVTQRTLLFYTSKQANNEAIASEYEGEEAVPSEEEFIPVTLKKVLKNKQVKKPTKAPKASPMKHLQEVETHHVCK